MASVHRRPNSKFFHAAWRSADGTLKLRSTKQTNRAKALAFALECERADKLAGAGTLTEAKAREIVASILERTETGETLRSPTSRKFFEEWLAAKEASKTRSTIARYGKTVTEFLGHLGPRADKPLTSLTSGLIESFIAKRLRANLTPYTVALDAKVLRTALNRARRQGLLATNPAEAVELPTGKSVERGVYTPAEVKMLLDAANGEWRTLILVAYYTGQRLSDCVRLAWADVDLSNRTWTLQQGKTGTRLVVPLHPELATHLETVADLDTPAEFVMPGMAGKGPGGRHGLSESFKAIMRKAGVDHQPVARKVGVRTVSRRSFHALRHSFTSALANAGISPEVRMRRTGHSTDASHRTYTHHEIETLREAVTKLPSLG